ncbi:hypothetical protein L596_030691 [Steinernema carpocapsae]|uniref:Helitron helicase-like domain-containing protein n=1 Tax=Steinernema carpocapsae TaxID=34508 RepID=A0A4U5LNG4_STECR|nr:hypothetical protein L596_030691 [Steinernema carpocapsae]
MKIEGHDMQPVVFPACYPILNPKGVQGYRYGIPLRHNGEEGETQGEVEEGPRRQFIVGQAPAQGPRKFVSARAVVALPRLLARTRRQGSATGYGRMKPWRSSTRSACATRSNATKCTTGKASRTASRDRSHFDKHSRRTSSRRSSGRPRRTRPSDGSTCRAHLARKPPVHAGQVRRCEGHFESRSSNQVHYFVTFTGNPQWPEFQRNMPNTRKGHQSIIHNPNVVNRVFKAKLDELLKDLTGGNRTSATWKAVERSVRPMRCVLRVHRVPEQGNAARAHPHRCGKTPENSRGHRPIHPSRDSQRTTDGGPQRHRPAAEASSADRPSAHDSPLRQPLLGGRQVQQAVPEALLQLHRAERRRADALHASSAESRRELDIAEAEGTLYKRRAPAPDGVIVNSDNREKYAAAC